MATKARPSRRSEWRTAHLNVREARALIALQAARDAHPDQYLVANPDQAAWDDLLKGLE